jgi:hypothetical protein
MIDNLKSILHKKSPKELRALLPWYVNDTLTAADSRAVDSWLRRGPEAQAELAAWQQVRTAVVGQAQQRPSLAVRQQIMAQVQSVSVPPRRSLTLPQLAWGLGLALIVLLLLWITIQPGIVLQWSVNDDPLASFRVYRAAVGSADFGLVGEFPADAVARQYSYVDTRLLPGQTYVYRVEAVSEGGGVDISQAITANALDALPGQLAILLTSLIAGCGAVAAARRWQLEGWGSWGVGGLVT